MGTAGWHLTQGAIDEEGRVERSENLEGRVNVRHDPHDFQPIHLGGVGSPDSLSDRIVPWPQGAGHGFIDDCDMAAVATVAFQEVTSAEEPDPDGREMARGDRIEIAERLLSLVG